MTDICRLCASLKILNQLVTIGEPELDILPKLIRCCNIELPRTDDFLPQSVCRDCVQNLNASWAFSEKVLQAQETLRQAFLVDINQQDDAAQGLLQTTNVVVLDEHVQDEQLTVSIESANQLSRRKKKQPTKMMVDEIEKEYNGQVCVEYRCFSLFSLMCFFQSVSMLPYKIRNLIVTMHLKQFSSEQISSKLRIQVRNRSNVVFFMLVINI